MHRRGLCYGKALHGCMQGSSRDWTRSSSPRALQASDPLGSFQPPPPGGQWGSSASPGASWPPPAARAPSPPSAPVPGLPQQPSRLSASPSRPTKRGVQTLSLSTFPSFRHTRRAPRVDQSSLEARLLWPMRLGGGAREGAGLGLRGVAAGQPFWKGREQRRAIGAKMLRKEGKRQAHAPKAEPQ